MSLSLFASSMPGRPAVSSQSVGTRRKKCRSQYERSTVTVGACSSPGWKRPSDDKRPGPPQPDDSNVIIEGCAVRVAAWRAARSAGSVRIAQMGRQRG